MSEENKQLAVYEDYRAKVNGFKNINSSLVFDYESKKGGKDARSHIAKMKKVKTAINRVRIDEAKKYQVDLNAESALLTADVEEMILVHQRPLDEFESREKIRIDAIQKRIAEISTRDHPTESSDIQKEIDLTNLIDLDDGFFAEFLGEAITEVGNRLYFLNGKLAVAIQYEADQAELEKFREEKEEREAKEAADERERVDAEAMKKIDRENSDEGFQTQCDTEEDSKTLGVGESELDAPFMDNEGKFHPEDLKPTYHGYDKGTKDLSVTANVSIAPDKSINTSNVKSALTATEKRLEAEADIESLGFNKKQSQLLVRKISFHNIRHIKFEL